MNFRQLEAYQAVMVTGSVTRAAAVLHISQPAVSRLLSQLEENIGFSLFKRTKGRLYPTPEGETFFKVVETAFIRIEQIKEKARIIKEIKFGHLKIASMPALALDFLPRVVSRFVENRPHVHVSLDISGTPRVLERMMVQQYDIGLAVEPVEDQTYDMETLTLACMCLLPQGHKGSHKQVVGPQDLEGESFISPGEEHRIRFHIDQAFNSAQVKRWVRFETPLFQAASSMVKYGLGVAIVDPFTAISSAKNGIVARPFRPIIPFHLGILYTKDRPRSQLGECFVRDMKKCIDDENIELIKE